MIIGNIRTRSMANHVYMFYLKTLFLLLGGAVLFPCDFEQGFCQWYHSSDSDFTWTRNQGRTPSRNTGPDADHTTGVGALFVLYYSWIGSYVFQNYPWIRYKVEVWKKVWSSTPSGPTVLFTFSRNYRENFQALLSFSHIVPTSVDCRWK